MTTASVLISFGINPAVASASIHASEGVVDIVSAFFHLKLGNVETSMLMKLLIPGGIGSFLGALSISHLSINVAKPFINTMLLAMGCMILYRHIIKREGKKRKYLSGNKLLVLGFIAAFIDVSCGGGWGPICTPSFILDGMPPNKAIGTVEFTEPIISWIAVLTFGFTLGFKAFMWNLFLPMVIGGIVLTPIASYVCKKISGRVLGILVGLWVIILNLRALIF